MDRGVELSLNFLVVVIIAVVIFGFGISFIYRLAANSDELKSMTLQDIDQQIIDLRCRYNEKVCLENERIELKPKELRVLGIQVLNINSVQTDFRIRVEKGIYVDRQNVRYAPGEDGWDNPIEVLPEERVETIQANEAKTLGIGLELPKSGARPGTYVFDILIDRQEGLGFTEYDPVHKLYVEVT